MSNINIKTGINTSSNIDVKTNEKKISPYFSIATSKARIKTIADTRISSSAKKNA